jgi:co-chaperonin GroES (HSP10)
LNVSGKDENGVEPTVKIGDTVLYNRFITTVEEHDYVQFISMKEGDIIAIIKK